MANEVKTVEQRWSERKPLNVECDIYRMGGAPLRGKSRDICLGGMWVDTGEERLPKNAVVDVVLLADETEAGGDIHVRAMVVRNEDGGSALMFHDVDVGAFRRLQNLLLKT
jgi:hypothetical protein